MSVAIFERLSQLLSGLYFDTVALVFCFSVANDRHTACVSCHESVSQLLGQAAHMEQCPALSVPVSSCCTPVYPAFITARGAK